MNDIEGEDLALLERFSKRATMSAKGRKLKEQQVPGQRTRGTGRWVQMNLSVRSEWKEQLIALANEDRRSMISIIETGVQLYRAQREALK